MILRLDVSEVAVICEKSLLPSLLEIVQPQVSLVDPSQSSLALLTRAASVLAPVTNVTDFHPWYGVLVP